MTSLSDSNPSCHQPAARRLTAGMKHNVQGAMFSVYNMIVLVTGQQESGSNGLTTQER